METKPTRGKPLPRPWPWLWIKRRSFLGMLFCLPWWKPQATATITLGTPLTLKPVDVHGIPPYGSPYKYGVVYADCKVIRESITCLPYELVERLDG